MSGNASGRSGIRAAPDTSYIGVTSIFESFKYRIVASLVSSFFFYMISSIGHRLELTIIVFEVFVLWTITEKWMRSTVPKLWSVDENVRWNSTILSMLDFFSWVLMFLLFEMFLSLLTAAWTDGDLSYGESIVGFFTITFGTFSLYQFLSGL